MLVSGIVSDHERFGNIIQAKNVEIMNRVLMRLLEMRDSAKGELSRSCT